MADATLRAQQPVTGETNDDGRNSLTIGVLVAHDISGALAQALARELPGALHERFPASTGEPR